MENKIEKKMKMSIIFEENEFKYNLYKHDLFGRHIQKLKNYKDTNEKIIDNELKVYQLFTGSPKSYDRNVIEEIDANSSKKLVHDNELSMYIHSAFIINLAHVEKMKKPLECLQSDLTEGIKLGSKGVVVHVGKHVNKYTPEIAIKNMKTNIESLNIGECPLLIETPAGQGTELLVKISDFIKFVKELQETVGTSKVGVCVDTCHVFASGYDPLFYLKELDKHEIVTNLVHFNDSKCPCGSKKDRHDFPDKGNIGEETLLKVREFCIEKNIPMVLEM